MILEDPVYKIRSELFVRFVGNVFDKISDLFLHLLREADSEALLQDIVHAALSGLAVDSDDVGVISSSNILRIDRKVRNGPLIAVMFFSPCHDFCDLILMRS